MPGNPSGRKLKDGFSTRVNFASNSTIQLWIKSPKPPGFSGRGGIDTTTMHNVRVITKAPKHLLDVTDSTIEAAYDEGVYTAILALLQKNQLITFTFPSGMPLDIYGWLDQFEPMALKEGEFPLANITIVSSNTDSADAEVVPTVGTSTSSTSTTTTTSV